MLQFTYWCSFSKIVPGDETGNASSKIPVFFIHQSQRVLTAILCVLNHSIFATYATRYHRGPGQSYPQSSQFECLAPLSQVRTLDANRANKKVYNSMKIEVG